MKNNKVYLTAINLMLLAVILTSCKEYTTKTKINPDGSCTRIIVVEGDTSKIAALPFPIPTGKTWQIETRKSEKDSTKVVYSAEKSFKDVNDLNTEYRNKSKIKVEVKFEKKFRWFYTYYEYEEIYKSYFPIKSIPLKEFLNKEDYQKFLDGDTTKAFKNKLAEYADKNYKDYFLAEFLKTCKNHNISGVSQASIDANKNQILEKLEDKKGDITEVIKSLEIILGTKSLKLIQSDLELIVEDIAKKIEWTGTANGTYTNQISMPGVILTTNSKSVKGNTVEWKVDSDQFQYDDLVMNVESRSANVASFIVTGIIIALALLLLIIPKLRRK
jgi:hypothetical protein